MINWHNPECTREPYLIPMPDLCITNTIAENNICHRPTKFRQRQLVAIYRLGQVSHWPTDCHSSGFQTCLEDPTLSAEDVERITYIERLVHEAIHEIENKPEDN
jgi:hypothetical protein